MLRHALTILTTVVLLLSFGVAHAGDAVPPPREMAADIVVSGRTSTAKKIDIVNVGNNVPKTYAGAKLGPSPGFSFWVSRHFALKTDYGEKEARLWLTLLELAYPHYVELFGAEPPGIGTTRMPVVEASSYKKLVESMKGDGYTAGISMGAGGLVPYYNRTSYLYPSSPYLSRHLLLHECVHMFQMCVAGSTKWTTEWYAEGSSDYFCSHNWDSERQQLTLQVFDKGPYYDYLDTGLRTIGRQSAKSIHDRKQAPRAMNYLLYHFFMDDPDRRQRFKVWRDEMLHLGPGTRERSKKRSNELMTSLFGSWEEINSAFAAWVKAQSATWHMDGRLTWGWNQDGETLWVWSLGPRFSQLDVDTPPGEKPRADGFWADYPHRGRSPLVGPVKRGVAEPSVGCVLHFSRYPKDTGKIGIGLGVVEKGQERPCLRLLVGNRRRLLIEGKALGIRDSHVDLPGEFVKAVADGGDRLGMTVTVGTGALKILLQAGDPVSSVRPLARFEKSVPLNGKQRKRILTGKMAIYGQKARHGVTPYFDWGKRPVVDLTEPAPPNRWRSRIDPVLACVYKAAWRLGKAAPESLIREREGLLAAFDADVASQGEALEAFERKLPGIVKEIDGSGSPKARTAIADLSGCTLRVHPRERSDERIPVFVSLKGPHSGSVRGGVDFSVSPPPAASSVHVPRHITMDVTSGKWRGTQVSFRAGRDVDSFRIGARARLEWYGVPLRLDASCGDHEATGFALRTRTARRTGAVDVTALVDGPFEWDAKVWVTYRLKMDDGTVREFKDDEFTVAALKEGRTTRRFGQALVDRAAGCAVEVEARCGNGYVRETVPLGWCAGLDRMYRGAWLLGGEAPASLVALKKDMEAAAGGDAGALAAAAAAFGKRFPAAIRDVGRLKKTPRTSNALAEILGVSLDVEVDAQSTTAHPVLRATVRGTDRGKMAGTVTFGSAFPGSSGAGASMTMIDVPLGGTATATWKPDTGTDHGPFVALVTADLEWEEFRLTLTKEVACRPSVPMWRVLGPFDNPGGATEDRVHPPETEIVNVRRTYPGQKGNTIAWRTVRRDPESKANDEFMLVFDDIFGQGVNAACYAVVWVHSPRDTDALFSWGSEDGGVVWVNGERVYQWLHGRRGYRSKGDVASVSLRKGVNEILVKVNVTGNGWKFCGHLDGADGEPLRGVTYSVADEGRLNRLYRALWTLGDGSPRSLRALIGNWPRSGKPDMEAYNSVVDEVARLRPGAASDAALAALLGVTFSARFDAGATAGEPAMTAVVGGAEQGELSGKIDFVAGPDGRFAKSVAAPVRIVAGGVGRASWKPGAGPGSGPFAVRARADLEWKGRTLTLFAPEASALPSVPMWNVIGPFNNPGGATHDRAHRPEKEPVDLSKKYEGQGGKTLAWKQVRRDPGSAVGSEYLLDLDKALGAGANAAAFLSVFVHADRATDAVFSFGSEDCAAVRLNGERVYGWFGQRRSYVSKSDKVPLRLKKGVNELLVKVTVTGNGWKFCGHLTDPDGDLLEGIRYSLGK